MIANAAARDAYQHRLGWRANDHLRRQHEEDAVPNPGFGRRNPHCSNCGDERGGSFGHEISECLYRSGMTVPELAATMPDEKRSRYLDAAIDHYFEQEESRG